MASKKNKGGRKGRKTIGIATALAGINSIVQMLEPIVTAGFIQAARAGDWAGAIAALRTGGKEAIKASNLIEAFGPVVGISVVKTLARRLHVPNRNVAGLGFSVL